MPMLWDMLTVPELSRELGVSEKAARAFAEAHQLLRSLPGLDGPRRCRVLWAEVVALRLGVPVLQLAIQRDPRATDPRAAGRRSVRPSLPKRDLRRRSEANPGRGR